MIFKPPDWLKSKAWPVCKVSKSITRMTNAVHVPRLKHDPVYSRRFTPYCETAYEIDVLEVTQLKIAWWENKYLYSIYRLFAYDPVTNTLYTEKEWTNGTTYKDVEGHLYEARACNSK